jgi:hypothetical protein
MAIVSMAYWQEHRVRMLDGGTVQPNILTPRLRGDVWEC